MFIQPRDQLRFLEPWMAGAYEHTYNQPLPQREGGSFHGKHSKKTHSASEDCSCPSHLTAFGSTPWAWQSQTLEWGQKHSSRQACSQRTGTAPGSWQHLKAGVQGPFEGKQTAGPTEGLASSQARASKTGWQGSLSGTRPDACCSFAAPRLF